MDEIVRQKLLKEERSNQKIVASIIDLDKLAVMCHRRTL